MRRTAVPSGSLTYEVPHAPRWSKLLLGLAMNCVCVLLLAITNPQFFTAPTLFAAAIDHHVTLTGPTSITQPELEPPRLVTPPRHLAKIEPRRPATPPPEQPIPISREPISPAVEPPRLSSNVPTSLPPKPAPEKQINTDAFSPAPSESATLPRSPKQVQTGGFGDPNGVPAQNIPNTVPQTLARLGAFDLPSAAGRGNPTAGSHGTSGSIGPAGFVNTTTSTHSIAQATGTVQTGGFRSVVSKETTPSAAQQAQEKPSLEPVEIIYKPRPAYTAEARQQRVEGEVLLEVVFTASGSLRVNRIVKGLGYGLDDMALAAAQRIQFHPAKRDGQPYDCAALVHIIFELPN